MLSGLLICSGCAHDAAGWLGPASLGRVLNLGGEECSAESCATVCEPFDAEDFAEFPLASDEVCEYEDSGQEAGFVQTASATMLSAFAMGGAAVGSVANYFVPAGLIAPSEIPPPGRFHPVPTHPVFAAGM